jgi:2-oxoglutarate ferredoxin oxidoreductase subunit delta
MPKGRVAVFEDRCKGCELCVQFCPQEMLSLAESRFNAIGYRPVEVTHPERCTGCEICAVVCPDVVFTVYRQPKARAREQQPGA